MAKIPRPPPSKVCVNVQQQQGLFSIPLSVSSRVAMKNWINVSYVEFCEEKFLFETFFSKRDSSQYVFLKKTVEEGDLIPYHKRSSTSILGDFHSETQGTHTNNFYKTLSCYRKVFSILFFGSHLPELPVFSELRTRRKEKGEKKKGFEKKSYKCLFWKKWLNKD